MTDPTSASLADWQARARAVLPGGGFGNFDPSVFIARGKGSRVWDEDGREFIDYLIGSGPMLLGHGHPEVLEAVEKQLKNGLTFFANNSAAIELAEEIIRAVPCAEQLRYVSSGGEADMYAMRLARAFTGRKKIIKFEGGYHGMSAEAQMSLAPSRLVNFPQAVPDSAGIPDAVRDDMLIAPFNDLAFVSGLMDEYKDQISGVIVEPLQRLIPPAPGFLEGLRELCTRHGIVLIFDEVVTGFRFDYGGAQALYGVTPDVCTLGKIIGGGFPLAAVTGKAEIMAHFDKSKVGVDGFLMQLGTLSGNPVAAVAGLKTLEILRRGGQYERLRGYGRRLMQLLTDALSRQEIPHRIVGDPTLFDVVFTDQNVRDYRHVFAADKNRTALFNKVLRTHGLLKSPGKLYAHLALTEADFQQTEAAFQAGAEALAQAG